MNPHIDRFVQPLGKEAGRKAIESYKESDSNFRDEFCVPMMYASGYTTAWIAKAFADEWITPLKKKARLAIIAAVIAMALLLIALGYGWLDRSCCNAVRIVVCSAMVSERPNSCHSEHVHLSPESGRSTTSLSHALLSRSEGFLHELLKFFFNCGLLDGRDHLPRDMGIYSTGPTTIHHSVPLLARDAFTELAGVPPNMCQLTSSIFIG